MTLTLSQERILKNIGLYTLVFLIAVFSLFPAYIMMVYAFKGDSVFEASYLPQFDWTNFKSVFGNTAFIRSIWNSFIVSSVVVLLSSVLSVTAAYALGRVQFKGRTLLLLTILSVSMFPQIAVLTGLYSMFQAWDQWLIASTGRDSLVASVFTLNNNYPALWISYMIFTLPFTVWVLTTFMRGLPAEIEESAMVDGANPLQIIFRLFLPIMAPAMVTTGLLAFIAAWNEFLFALTFMQSEEMRTIPPAIANFSGASEQELPLKNIMAASVVVTIPLIILVLMFQRMIVSGLTAGAVKG
ncbi:carbohydrate ABC transporter permease [Gammaproteobacteria bacterium]|nr:carbohydrate ABC transporter permease [Gammaproteobacteria bacterium]